MCLIRASKNLIAEVDIVCYKIVDKSGWIFKNYKTPVMKLDVTRQVKKHLPIVPEPLTFPDEGKFNIMEGAIHSYASLQSDNNFPTWALQSGYIIVQCKIPKGATYIIGRDGDYASSYLIPTKVLTKREIEVITRLLY